MLPQQLNLFEDEVSTSNSDDSTFDTSSIEEISIPDLIARIRYLESAIQQVKTILKIKM
ncbi:hypothetical protein [Acinetobacter stercoris]|uniref:Uncharacterized protein n=1 Tax=Acinetobacter stercoris TaxID=2126983 RepID=A0A2U3MUH6_9GAMM|nr:MULTISPECIES: hypothetical protein [Acinetobacter]SPL69072.1 hypothetical protein KPC_0250 [Acinetobacter stercoris]